MKHHDSGIASFSGAGDVCSRQDSKQLYTSHRHACALEYEYSKTFCCIKYDTFFQHSFVLVFGPYMSCTDENRKLPSRSSFMNGCLL